MDTLAKLNPHPRDDHIQFDEPTHTYTIDGSSDYVSVTTWNHSHFKNFDADKVIDNMMSSRNWPNSKYFGQSREEIKAGWEKNRDEAATAGTKMHYDIECYYNGLEVSNNSDEYRQFQKYLEDHPFKPYRTEWTVWDRELKLAGSIDMVYENDDGTLMIYDWKRSKGIVRNKRFEEYSTTECIDHLPDTNFWHYSLQLNTYKAILERNYNKKVTKLCLVCLYPGQDTYKLFEVPDLTEEIDMLFALRKTQLEET
jgi:ATP-dependent exoDNAse (exonuclease V) beta subunit